MRWSYGVTTVPERRTDLLPRTLKSLAGAGFDRPRLFVDAWEGEDYSWTGLEVTTRTPRIKTWGNWILSLYELYIREPGADRFAVFQDDFVTYRGLREYLDSQTYLRNTYWNLYLFPSNESIVPRGGPANLKVDGWHKSNQYGRGAVALVFDLETVQALLSSREHVVERPTSASHGTRKVDGAVVDALRKQGWTEMVHFPSLTQHTGKMSTMRNPEHQMAMSFRGEDFDVRTMLRDAPTLNT